VVVDVGPGVTETRAGQKVMMHHYSGCRTCRMCRMGYTQMCFNHHEIYGFTKDGGHQEFLLAPGYSCVSMPDGLSFEEGAACACGTGTAFHAVKRLRLEEGESLAVFGQGPVGLSATLFAAAAGARVIAVDVVPERLDLARKLGAAIALDGRAPDTLGAIRELTGGEGADATLDATGLPQVRLQAVESARVWGRMVFVGEGGDTTIDVSRLIIHRQLTVYGSWTFSIGGLAEAAQHVVDRGIRLKDLITHTFPLDRIDEAYRLFASGTSGKVVIRM
jgi:L-iditol 2-dehydrogenase